MKQKRLCPIHGLWLKDQNQTTCPSCANDRHKEYDKYKRDPELAKFYHSAAWKRVRNDFINKNPLCAICNRPADVVDHIVEIKDGCAKLNYSNLQSLCHSCHNAKTADARAMRGVGQISTDPSQKHRAPSQTFTKSVSGGTPWEM